MDDMGQGNMGQGNDEIQPLTGWLFKVPSYRNTGTSKCNL